MLRTVHLHGPLRRDGITEIRIVGDTFAEVLEGVSRQVPALQPTAQGRARVMIVGCDSETDLYAPLGDRVDIHIVPQLMGGKSAISQVLVGALLIGVSFIPGIGPSLSSALLKVGMLTALSGVSMMLSPQPEADTGTGQSSKYLGSPKNTTQIGTRIPILYGEYKWGGHFLSFDINAIDVRPEG